MDSEFWNQEFAVDPGHVDVPDQVLAGEVEGLSLGSALDLGCGSGVNAVWLAARGWSVVGVDWSDRAIELANQRAAAAEVDATFVVGDTTEWQPPSTYDLVVSTFALPGDRNTGRVLGTASRALARGGTVIVADWDRSMSEMWSFDPMALATPDEISAHLVGLTLETVEVRHVANAFPPDDPRAHAGTAANVAFVRARKPLS